MLLCTSLPNSVDVFRITATQHLRTSAAAAVAAAREAAAAHSMLVSQLQGMYNLVLLMSAGMQGSLLLPPVN